VLEDTATAMLVLSVPGSSLLAGQTLSLLFCPEALQSTRCSCWSLVLVASK